jgi:hypothetical protein
MTDWVLYSSSISLISSALNSTSHPLIRSSSLSKLVVPTIGAVMNGLLKLQASATWAILMFLFLAIVSTLPMTALAAFDTGRPPDWDRSVPASLSCGLARSGCQLTFLSLNSSLRPPARGDQGIQPTPKCCRVGIISRSSYHISEARTCDKCNLPPCT